MCRSLGNPQVAAATAAAQGMLAEQPCQPVLSEWSPGSARVTVGGMGALENSSECLCDWRGVVTVTDAGQTATSLQ